MAPIEVKSNVVYGPFSVGDPDLMPLVAKAISVLSAGGISLLAEPPLQDPDRDSARRLTALSALLAAGEARTIIVLVSTGLSLHSRIHLRTVDDLLRRINVYGKNPKVARETETTIKSFQAEGFAKLDAADRERIEKRDDEMSVRVAELLEKHPKPLWITDDEHYKKKHVAGLDDFQRWAYSQIEHGTVLALAELTPRLSANADDLYATADAPMLLTTTAGMLLAIMAHLSTWQVDVHEHFTAVQGRLSAVLAGPGIELNNR
jgi:hypothetical protein